MNGLTRGQLAQRAQINLETVRFYEQEGLLPPAARTASGYRKFSETAVDRLEFVKRAKTLGFSLREVRELLVFHGGSAHACEEVRDLLLNKLAIVRKKMDELEKLEAQLRTALRKCNKALKGQEPQHPKPCPVLKQMANSHTKVGL
jgi:DNA-binding transcriptional MerR regulator